MVIVFDGVCNLCNRSVRFLLERDSAEIFRFAQCQSEVGTAILNKLGEDADDPSTFVLVDGDKIYLRSTGALRTLAALGGIWRAALLLLIVPRPIRDAAYTHIARRRYRWFGRTEQCEVPDMRWRNRFLP